MNETQQKGCLTELGCQLELTKRNILVSLPIIQDSRYDMIMDYNNKLIKIQIKTCRLSKNNTGIVFNTASSRMNHTEGNIKIKYSKDEIDFFATMYNNQMYLIPIEYCQGMERLLVFQHSKTYNGKYIEYLLEDFELDKILEKIKNNYNFNQNYQNNIKEKQICQYDLHTKELLNIYCSYEEAARQIGKPGCSGHISEAARGIRNNAYGFLWEIKK